MFHRLGLILPIFLSCVILVSSQASSSSYQQQGNVIISIKNGVIQCSNLTCPRGSTKCKVIQTRSNPPQLPNPIRVSYCYSNKDGKEIEVEKKNETLPRTPENDQNIVMESSTQNNSFGSSSNSQGSFGNFVPNYNPYAQPNFNPNVGYQPNFPTGFPFQNPYPAQPNFPNGFAYPPNFPYQPYQPYPGFG